MNRFSKLMLIGLACGAAVALMEKYGFRLVGPQEKTGCSRNIGASPNARLKPPWFWWKREVVISFPRNS